VWWCRFLQRKYLCRKTLRCALCLFQALVPPRISIFCRLLSPISPLLKLNRQPQSLFHPAPLHPSSPGPLTIRPSLEGASLFQSFSMNRTIIVMCPLQTIRYPTSSCNQVSSNTHDRSAHSLRHFLLASAAESAFTRHREGNALTLFKMPPV
jgi:hypothetical protein